MSRTNCAIGKDYVPASFKGVGFWCTEASIEGGRRGAEGEFPFGEDTAYADLGRKIRTFNLTAVFREDDHVGDASNPICACESPNPASWSIRTCGNSSLLLAVRLRLAINWKTRKVRQLPN